MIPAVLFELRDVGLDRGGKTVLESLFRTKEPRDGG
jgi:hypothetical protein